MAIKEKFRSSFFGRMLINYWHEIEGFILPKVISDEKAVKRYYKKHTGKELSLDNPQTFSEKMCWYKLNAKNELMSQCADKVGVRDYVESKGYGKNLNEIYGIYSSVKDIPIDKLPNKFVLKAAHGTHMQIIVKDKQRINWKQAKSEMRSWLRQDIYWRGREWVYQNIPHRIIAEKYLEDETGELRDFKFFCFNGVPRFIQVDIGRYNGKHVRNFYNIEWEFMDISDDAGCDKTIEIQRPKAFKEMVDMAASLSNSFQFVRVDFYEVDGTPFVGELTFFHNGGVSRMKPQSWEKIIGDYWTLVK